MNISLQGKRILIAGATGAIGGAILQAAREGGASVAGSYFKNPAKADQFRRQGVQMIQADLSDPAQAREMVRQVLEAGEPLDALVYSAGNTRDHTLAKLTQEEWSEVFKLHLDGLFAVCQAALPAMQERRQGKIAAIGSLSGLIGRVGQANYSAAKAGTVGFIKSLAKEMGRFGITANVVCPGFIDSAMTRSAPPQAWERAKSDSALGTLSKVETVASFLVWLLSDLCQGVTGQVFQLDSRIT